jgi:hypothetical protein
MNFPEWILLLLLATANLITFIYCRMLSQHQGRWYESMLHHINEKARMRATAELQMMARLDALEAESDREFIGGVDMAGGKDKTVQTVFYPHSIAAGSGHTRVPSAVKDAVVPQPKFPDQTHDWGDSGYCLTCGVSRFDTPIRPCEQYKPFPPVVCDVPHIVQDGRDAEGNRVAE